MCGLRGVVCVVVSYSCMRWVCLQATSPTSCLMRQDKQVRCLTANQLHQHDGAPTCYSSNATKYAGLHFRQGVLSGLVMKYSTYCIAHH
jgi:hypothetical protein